MFTITQNGKPLDPSKYTWDEDTKTLTTNEDNLILDFSSYKYVTFKTGRGCTFHTGSDCTFDTKNFCNFITGNSCVFNTWDSCTFHTGRGCTFDTGHNCTFSTEKNCVIIRRDIFEIIQPEEGKTIKLNDWGVKGYTLI